MRAWYKEGLNFKCTGCGKCCTGTSGVVWVNNQEIDSMAAFLKISRDTFLQSYTRLLGDRVALLERRNNGKYDCIFLKDNKCRVYEDRPKQCRTFPWWEENLNSKERWEELKEYCEGVDHPDAHLTTFSEIEKNRCE